MKKTILIILGLVILAVVFLFFSNGMTGNVIASEPYKIPLSEISETAKYYEYQGIKFFVVKSGDEIKTAFDACDVCYRSKKGYRQEGKYMVCNNCGNRYLISELGTENKAGGGCWPGYLPNEIQGENLVIQTSDIEKGGYRFK